MISKLLFSTMLISLTISAQAESLAGVNDYLVNSNSRENCRLNVPSLLIEAAESTQSDKRFLILPLRQSVPAEFCQKNEEIIVDKGLAKILEEESQLYTAFMTMAMKALANGAGESRIGLVVGEKFSLDLDLEVFNYQVAGLIQGDKCTANLSGEIGVAGFLGPKGVLLRYENGYQNDTPIDSEECPNGTIALLDQSEFQNLIP